MRSAIASLVMFAVSLTAMFPIAGALLTSACCDVKSVAHCPVTADSVTTDMPGMDMSGSQAVARESESTEVAQGDVRCPMTCCSAFGTAFAFVVGHPQTIVANVQLTRLIASDSSVFVSAGFSSHTDRGPPRS